MRRFSNEFLVGLLTLVVAVLTAWGITRTDDMADGSGASGYRLVAYVPSAEGVFRSTPVRVAGVIVGSVEQIELEGGRARITLAMVGDAQLPTDSVAELKSEGMLGDRFLRVLPGSAPSMLADGDTLAVAEPGADLDAMTQKLSGIADDVKAITGALRQVADDPTTRQQLQSTMANVEALSQQLRDVTGENRAEVAQITANLREVSETLNRVVGSAGTSVEQEMNAIRQVTATLDATLSTLRSIAEKVDHGDGTVGRLLNDPTTIDSVNDTLAKVNGMVGSVSDIRTQVYYRGNVYFGSDPRSGPFEGNPMAGGMRNVLGVRLGKSDDYAYLVEVVSHPIGTIGLEQRTIPEFGTAYTEYVVRPDYRFSFQFMKRFDDLAFRFGVKESSGGVGVDWMLFDDRVTVTADVYDFLYGSWPAMDGTPNVQLTLRAEPWRNVYFEGGLDNVVLGARYGYVTGFVGGGFRFTDDDLKFVLAALPISP